MEIIRNLLWGAFFFLCGLLWHAWNQDFRGINPAQKVVINESIPTPHRPSQNELKPTQSHVTFEKVNQVSPSRYINFQTDTLKGVIDTQGGHLIHLDLLKYPQDAHTEHNIPFALFHRNPARHGLAYLAETDLVELNRKDLKPRNYETPRLNYVLSPGQTTLTIPLSWHEGSLSIKKQFVITQGSYLIKVNYQVKNQAQNPFRGQLYTQLKRHQEVHKKGWFSTTPYVGGVISTKKKPYEKVPFDSLKKQLPKLSTENQWIAMVEPYFVSAWIPHFATQFYQEKMGQQYTLGAISALWEVPAGKQRQLSASLYAGPKVINRLYNASKNLERVVDYGIFSFASRNLFWLLDQFYSMVGNWGWAIVLLTLSLKLVFYRLSLKGFRARLALRRLHPQIEALKKRHDGDQHALNQATWELYRREKVNPFGGILPMLIQIPVFIAFYWMLSESVELRQTPFMFWIKDLASKDPYYILPALTGLSMFFDQSLQQKLNPPASDPVQEKMMLLFPLVFSFVLFNFPAGLVLYWLTSNLASIAQNVWMMRQYKVI